MPPIFSGDYIKDAIDFMSVATEVDVINAFDDPENPVVPAGVETFAEFLAADPTAYARTITVANEVIRDAEEEVETSARAYGYKIPLAKAGVPDSYAKALAVRLAWISARLRRKMISSEQADQEKSRIQRDELKAIERGYKRLTADLEDSSVSQSATVYAVTSSARIHSRELWDE